MSNNQLQSIDLNFIRQCAESLFELHIDNNRIQSLPEEIILLRAMKVLEISNNELIDLQPSLGYINALQRYLFIWRKFIFDDNCLQVECSRESYSNYT